MDSPDGASGAIFLVRYPDGAAKAPFAFVEEETSEHTIVLERSSRSQTPQDPEDIHGKKGPYLICNFTYMAECSLGRWLLDS